MSTGDFQMLAGIYTSFLELQLDLQYPNRTLVFEEQFLLVPKYPRLDCVLQRSTYIPDTRWLHRKAEMLPGSLRRSSKPRSHDGPCIRCTPR